MYSVFFKFFNLTAADSITTHPSPPHYTVAKTQARVKGIAIYRFAVGLVVAVLCDSVYEVERIFLAGGAQQKLSQTDRHTDNTSARS